MDEQNRNLLLAMVLSTAVLFVWFILFPPPEPTAQRETSGEQTIGDEALPGAVPSADAGLAAAQTETTPTQQDDAQRIGIETPSLSGSISAAGGRIDTLSLRNYNVSLDDDASQVQLLSPIGNAQPYYTLFGWAPGGELTASDVPGPDTVWSLPEGAVLTPGSSVEMTWESPAGPIFRRVVSVDDRFMFTVTQTVENPTSSSIRLAPYGVVARHGEPQDLMGFFIIHEGAIRMADGELRETDYDDIPDLDADPVWGASSEVIEVQETGWIGFTDHYWMTTLIPAEGSPFTAVTQYVPGADVYRTLARYETVEVPPGGATTSTTQVFAGAKEWETIRDYEAGREITGFAGSLSYFMGFSEETGIDGFIDAIDWGWFYFLTKPIFFLLHELNVVIGNMGWAIIALTLLIKALLFPLARKSYISMARMKELQPEMEKIKERAGDDRQKLQTEMMSLYKKEKVNPASGCLPILLQIPIFFSLYKVIFVTIELRHAPFFGPFQDLSAPDPTSIFNFYGLLPWAAPEPTSLMALIFIGILPLLLGVTMWLQQKLNPAPTDPTQAMIFAWMPWVFMFMLGGFASGLVIYWIANNTITFVQQYTIMWSHGYKPDLLGNIRSSVKKGDGNKPANSDKSPAKKVDGDKPKKK